MTTQVPDLLEAILLAGEKAADVRNDEAVFGLLDRIENPTGPLWDLIRELRLTCEYRYVERKVRRKETYLQNWLDARDFEDYDPKNESWPREHATVSKLWGRRRSEPLGPYFIRTVLDSYRHRLNHLSPCRKCRICVREKIFPAVIADAGPHSNQNRRLRDRQLAKALVAEKTRNVAGLLSEVLKTE